MPCKVRWKSITKRLLGFTAAAVSLSVLATSVSTQSGTTGSLAASPTSGQAPLTVTFTGRAVGDYESVVILDFGDRQIDDSLGTGHVFTRTHTYAKSGSYTAELRSGPWLGDRPAVLKTVTKITITVR